MNNIVSLQSRIVLTPDQARAKLEIIDGFERGSRHLLTGSAGTGKTRLVAEVVAHFLNLGYSVVVSAPTHKAVAVAHGKLMEAGIYGVECRTIDSVLELKPKVVGDRQVFERRKGASPFMATVLVVDECSMLDTVRMGFIRRYLPVSYCLLVGDPAQLPPIGEQASEAFETKAHSHLETIVRQAAGNPIIRLATMLREAQGKPFSWDWARESMKMEGAGVYRPREAEAWMRKAFTSPEFDKDPDLFRYLCWTNARVASINAKVRQWRYGHDIPTPFVVGERLLLRAPLMRDGALIYANNEEVDLLEIEKGTWEHPVKEGPTLAGWLAQVPSWRMVLRLPGSDQTVEAHMVRDTAAWQAVENRIRDEAGQYGGRWQHLQDMKREVLSCQSVYAMTCHSAQGSTFGTAFVDVQDIANNATRNPLETQQMLYVAATRPSRILVLVGVR